MGLTPEELINHYDVMRRAIKYIRIQVDGHTIVEFVNGSRACSCGLERGETPSLRPTP